MKEQTYATLAFIALLIALFALFILAETPVPQCPQGKEADYSQVGGTISFIGCN